MTILTREQEALLFRYVHIYHIKPDTVFTLFSEAESKGRTYSGIVKSSNAIINFDSDMRCIEIVGELQKMRRHAPTG